MELKGDFYCMDGKIRFLIVGSQVLSRKKHGKASKEQKFLIVFCLEAWQRGWFCPVDGGQWPFLLGGHLVTWYGGVEESQVERVTNSTILKLLLEAPSELILI
jgi:hypothetical protein